MNDMAIIDMFDVPDWARHAACRSSSPDMFFPEQGDSHCVKLAKQVCATCKVQAPCLEGALDRRERHGVFGGKTERERRVILRERRGLAERFWEKVNKTDGCWLWTGSKRHTYGEFWLEGEKVYAHRVAFFITHHYWPTVVMHRCDTPLCVRPDHLAAGTQSDNIADMRAKGRGTTPPMHKGTAHHQAKLDPEKVHWARCAYAQGEHTQSELATLFGMSQASVGAMLRRETWKDVA